jgi:hypothetical protein
MDELRDIIKGCNRRDYSRAEQKDFKAWDGKKVRVFKVEGEEKTLFYWNSSNQADIRHSTALANIADELLDDNEEGTVQDGWNEIMFETEYN